MTEESVSPATMVLEAVGGGANGHVAESRTVPEPVALMCWHKAGSELSTHVSDDPLLANPDISRLVQYTPRSCMHGQANSYRGDF